MPGVYLDSEATRHTLRPLDLLAAIVPGRRVVRPVTPCGAGQAVLEKPGLLQLLAKIVVTVVMTMTTYDDQQHEDGNEH